MGAMDFTFWIFVLMIVETFVNFEQHQYVQGARYRENIHRCPKGLGDSMFTFRDKCYRFVARDKDWNPAQADCHNSGGNLVHIHDRATQDFIWNAARAELGWTVNGMWIGAHDQRFQRNSWEWVLGNTETKGVPIQWSFWDLGQPSCGVSCIEFCAQLRFDEGGRWHDYKCSNGLWFVRSKYHYCCMYDMTPTTTIKTTTIRTTTTSTKRTTTTANPTTEATTTTSTTTARSSVSHKTNATVVNEKTTTSFSLGGGQSGRTLPIVAEGPSASNAHSGMDGGLIAAAIVGSLVALCIILLLLFFIRRRKQKKNSEEASDNFPNPTYNGGLGLPSHPAAFVNPQVDPCYTVSLPPVNTPPAKSSEANWESPYSECLERLENEQNACAASTNEHHDEGSKGIYEDLEFDIPSDLSDSDDDCKGASATKMKTPSVEYLHARSLVRPNPTYLTAQSVDSGIQRPNDVFDPNRTPSAVDNIYGPDPFSEQTAAADNVSQTDHATVYLDNQESHI